MPPPILYHYTSQEGLLGIVTDKAIWSSSIAYLNDAAEFRHALQVLKAQADILKASAPEEEAPALDRFVADAEEFELSSYTFASSFSENGDLLSQWRGYSPIGAGYSIGFDSQALEATTCGNIKLQPCIYDTKEQNALVCEVLNKTLAIFRENRDKSALTLGQHLITHLYDSFYELAPRLKHPSYSEEQEWRLIARFSFWPGHAPRWRKGKSVPIPYVPLQLDRSNKQPIIRKIIVGPTPYPELAIRSLKLLTTTAGISDVDIVSSAVPYRA